DSILFLSRNCVVNATNNLFHPSYNEYFRLCLEQARAEDPTRGPTVEMSTDYARMPPIPQLSLSQRLREWSDAFEREASPEDWGSRPRMAGDEAAFQQTFQPLLNLDRNDQEEIEKYLGKLTQTADCLFHNRDGREAGIALIRRMDRILRFACENEEFRNKMM